MYSFPQASVGCGTSLVMNVSAARAAVRSENKLNLPLQCQCISFGTVITLKDANEVNRQYYAGIRSYAACITLYPNINYAGIIHLGLVGLLHLMYLSSNNKQMYT